jgi:hypothetical protein
MNPETGQLLGKVIEALQGSIRAGDCPAVAAVGGASRTLTLSDYDYQRDDAAAASFERRAASKAAETGATRWVIAVPQVWAITPDLISVRSVSNLPLRPGESEAITWTAFDLADGVDYGRVPFTRQPRGVPVFGDIEIIAVQASPSESMPGYTMLRHYTRADAGQDDGGADTAH